MSLARYTNNNPSFQLYSIGSCLGKHLKDDLLSRELYDINITIPMLVWMRLSRSERLRNCLDSCQSRSNIQVMSRKGTSSRRSMGESDFGLALRK